MQLDSIPPHLYYILRDGIISTTQSLMEWGEWMQNGDRQIFDHEIDHEIRVSAVFLGLDHGYNNTRQPVLFETMIFGGAFNQMYQTRCALLSECSDMHYTGVDVALRSYDFKGLSWRNIKKIAQRRTHWMNEYLPYHQPELRRYYGKNKPFKRKKPILKKITEYKDILQ